MEKLSKLKIGVVTGLLMICLAFPVAGDDLSDALKRQREIDQQRSRAANNLKNLTIKAEQMEMQIRTLTREIQEAEKNLAAREQAYIQSRQNVARIQKEVDMKQKELEDRQNSLRKRVRTIYEEGQMSYLEVLFQSVSISDFISRVEYLGCLVANDQNILEGIRVQKQELLEKREQLVKEMEEAKRLQELAEAAKKVLDSKRAEKEAALAANKKDQDDLLIQIEKLEKDSKALESKIRELQSKNPGGVVGTISAWPTPGYWYITSPYGYRIHPITKVKSLHTGVDIGAPYGARINAAGDGTVIFAGWYGAYGNTVIVDHGNGFSTLYGHMSSIAVSTGQVVKAGQKVGNVGSTGWSTGPHLHFEVRKNGTPTNPMAYF